MSAHLDDILQAGAPHGVERLPVTAALNFTTTVVPALSLQKPDAPCFQTPPPSLDLARQFTAVQSVLFVLMIQGALKNRGNHIPL